MHGDVAEILFSREQIEERVKELAAQVMGVYREQDVTVAVALSGAFIFAADLVRHLVERVEVVFVRSSSYGAGTSPSGRPRIQVYDQLDWTGRHVLLVEDIVDTGATLAALVAELNTRGVASVRTCCFLDKRSRRTAPVLVDFVGFELTGPEFVVGYGLDLDGRYRNLPYVGVLRPGAT